MATQTEGRQKTTRQHELDALKYPFSVKPVQFMKLPTAMMEAEFSYFTKSSELKVHLWLLPGVNLRWTWEQLANAFGHKALKWTPEAKKIVPPHVIEGSIFIGLKANRRQVQNVVNYLMELDHKLMMHKIV